jgi:hypothetical protein
MITLRKHLKFSNVQRLHLALDATLAALHNQPPALPARARVQGVIRFLEDATVTPEMPLKEQEACGMCHTTAHTLRQRLRTPPAPPWMSTQRGGEEQHPTKRNM